MTEIRFSPFSNGTQWDDWYENNCARCVKSTPDEDGWPPDCPLLAALMEAQMDDGTVDDSTARGIGYLSPEGRKSRAYIWPCSEMEPKAEARP